MDNERISILRDAVVQGIVDYDKLPSNLRGMLTAYDKVLKQNAFKEYNPAQEFVTGFATGFVAAVEAVEAVGVVGGYIAYKGVKATPTTQYSKPISPELPKTKSGFQFMPTAYSKFFERFQGKISLDRFDSLLHSPDAIRVFDSRSGNINIYNSTELSKNLLRITVAPDGKRIVSTGFESLNRINNLIERGEFIKLN
ncbi:hypothetical protein [Brevibacillus sp. SAFN-007a]|uniref:hypothetical protein n=1 Tax=Brevibacillus sp. SAFN-007a TaxID=3436862 RepID=UPI003F7F3531